MIMMNISKIVHVKLISNIKHYEIENNDDLMFITLYCERIITDKMEGLFRKESIELGVIDCWDGNYEFCFDTFNLNLVMNVLVGNGFSEIVKVK